MSYDDPRLAAIYDADNPDGPDHAYFRALADEIGAERIVDLGCGTGILTVTLAVNRAVNRAGDRAVNRPGADRQVIGIDPAPAMLEFARSRPGGQAVEWRQGTSARIGAGEADVVLMTGNVAMHILGIDWGAALADIARGLRPGGVLAFESRNPAAEAWRNWNDAEQERDTAAGRLRESQVTTAPDADGVVTMHCHNDFLDAGGVVDVDQRLQFRTRDQLVADLEAVGLTVRTVWRDWSRMPFTDTAQEPLMIFEAVRAGI